MPHGLSLRLFQKEQLGWENPETKLGREVRLIEVDQRLRERM